MFILTVDTLDLYGDTNTHPLDKKHCINEIGYLEKQENSLLTDICTAILLPIC